jgi:hypothetical protein
MCCLQQTLTFACHAVHYSAAQHAIADALPCWQATCSCHPDSQHTSDSTCAAMLAVAPYAGVVAPLGAAALRLHTEGAVLSSPLSSTPRLTR